MPIITIGITGHRNLLELEKIMIGIETAIQCIFDKYSDANFRVLSSLAEGTDQILANRLLLNHNVRLWVPLPLPEEEYLQDFKSAESKAEFIRLLGKAERVIKMPNTNKRELGYRAAGTYIIENSDVLLAIWDGKPAQGEAGTADNILLARDHLLPIAWVHAGNCIPETSIPTSLGQEQGEVTFENF